MTRISKGCTMQAISPIPLAVRPHIVGADTKDEPMQKNREREHEQPGEMFRNEKAE
jgi:hypothetical protein